MDTTLQDTLPDPAQMTPQERLAAVNQYRIRAARKEELQKEEIHHAMRLLAAMRQTAVDTAGTRKKSEKRAASAEAERKADSLFGDL